jgi:hypothetical protein
MRHLLPLLLLAATPAMAGTATYDFEALPAGLLAGETLVVSDGGLTTTFTGTGLRIRSGFAVTGYGDRVLSSDSDGEPITAVFSQPVDFVTILNPINSVRGGEIDTIVMTAFDASNMVLGSITSDLDIISLSFAGIAYVVFEEGVEGDGYVIDSLTARFSDVVVPGPAPLALFGLGAVSLMVARRR